jgi:hypothetical protein
MSLDHPLEYKLLIVDILTSKTMMFTIADLQSAMVNSAPS